MHSALAEFDLALKALDTYIGLVEAARSRAEQSGRNFEGIEDSNIFIRTLSEGVITICCFGTYTRAEKAKQLTDLLERALTDETGKQIVYSHSNGAGSTKSTDPSSNTLALAYRAVGIGLAHWSKWTPITESRRDIQASAISSLEASLSEELGQDMNPATIFALGMMLAETRDLDAAIDLVRLALSSADVMGDGTQNSNVASYTGERDLVPLWHLLALLLSAREEFETASHICDAVFDTLLAGDSRPNGLNAGNRGSATELGAECSIKLFEDMEIRKKESILELRMTQLSLTEILHGPESAVNQAEELLALFGRLFTSVGPLESEQKQIGDHLAPPKTPTGGRSIRGSIFGRRKAHKEAGHDLEFGADGSTAMPSVTDLRLDGPSPAIQVTDENTTTSQERPHTAATRSDSVRRKDVRQPHKLHKRSGSITKSLKSLRHRSLERPSRSQAHPNQSHPDVTQTKSQDISTLLPDIQSPTVHHNESPSAKNPLPPIPHNMKHDKGPLPIGHSEQPPQQDVRLPTNGRHDTATKTLTRFPKAHVQKQALGLLTKIWLFVAGLYRRAGLFEDAVGAWNEAKQQAKRVEELVAKQESSAKAFADPGWGGAQSSDHLWADVYAERGLLFQAQSQPFEAMKQFEEALVYFPDHVRATVGLTNMLLDVWEQKLPSEEPEFVGRPDASTSSLVAPFLLNSKEADKPNDDPPPLDKDSPEYPDRLAARDRAYGLLSSLTKLGTAWDDSEAWFALSRAYEHSGQVEKAKEVLWWCIDLEDRRPVRHWWNVGSGGYVL